MLIVLLLIFLLIIVTVLCLNLKQNSWQNNICIFFPKMSIYEIYFDETKCMFFTIKEEKSFDKYMKSWKKRSNIIRKKFNYELIYIKKYVKVEKKRKN